MPGAGNSQRKLMDEEGLTPSNDVYQVAQADTAVEVTGNAGTANVSSVSGAGSGGEVQPEQLQEEWLAEHWGSQVAWVWQPVPSAWRQAPRVRAVQVVQARLRPLHL